MCSLSHSSSLRTEKPKSSSSCATRSLDWWRSSRIHPAEPMAGTLVRPAIVCVCEVECSCWAGASGRVEAVATEVRWNNCCLVQLDMTRLKCLDVGWKLRGCWEGVFVGVAALLEKMGWMFVFAGRTQQTMLDRMAKARQVPTIQMPQAGNVIHLANIKTSSGVCWSYPCNRKRGPALTETDNGASTCRCIRYHTNDSSPFVSKRIAGSHRFAGNGYKKR